MDVIREFLGRLTALTVEELATLRQAIQDEFTTLDGEDRTPEVASSMTELAEAADQLMAEESNRAAAQAEADTAAEAARERISALAPPEEPETPEAEPEAEAETPEAEAPAETPAAEPEPVAASGQRLARMAAGQRTAQPSPEAADPDGESRKAVVVASGALRTRKDKTEPIESRRELAEAMCETLGHMHRSSPPRGDIIVASATVEYPEDRRLTDDAWHNSEIIEAVCGPMAQRVDPMSMALVASGGICLPVNVDYAVPTWATAERPIRDGLAAFQATRGGLRFVQPPDIAEWEAATAIWTEATDASPGAETKPVVAMVCGAEELVYVEAVSTRIGFGNMQSRFAPEQVAANTDLAIAAAARVAENNLLNEIAAVCVKGVTAGTASLLGSTRELIPTIALAVAQQQQLHRLPDDQAYTAIFPRWVRELIRADLARESAHQQTESWNSLAITNAQIDELFKPYNVNPIWHLDGQGAGVEGSVSQIFASPSKAAIAKFPTKLVWYIFPDGGIQFLDAGRLDLGVVRDSTLDATNDYETFVETFEGIAKRTYANGALQMVTSLESTGAGALSISTAGKPPA
jgi:hypothetical protein